NIAEVDSNGLVKGVALGQARIVATADSRADTAVLMVVATPQAVVVEAPRNTLTLGDTVTFSVSVVNASGHPVGDVAAEWSVSDTTLLRVDESVLVRPVGPGTASGFAALRVLSWRPYVT